MSREDYRTKGRRYLLEARLRVIEANELDGHALVEVRSDSARLYTVSYEAGSGWLCDCAARGVCAHIAACGLIFVMEPRREKP